MIPLPGLRAQGRGNVSSCGLEAPTPSTQRSPFETSYTRRILTHPPHDLMVRPNCESQCEHKLLNDINETNSSETVEVCILHDETQGLLCSSFVLLIIRQ